MGGQYGKVGARIVVSSLLVTSLGLSVLAMAPAANAVEWPLCENIGQPGIIGTATETGARFTWDDVGDYDYWVEISRDDWKTYDEIEVGNTHEYVAPWNENGVVTDFIEVGVLLDWGIEQTR